MRTSLRWTLLLAFALSLGGCNREAERREQARLAAEAEEKEALERKLKEMEEKVSTMGCAGPEPEEEEQRRFALQRQLADAEREAKAAAAASGKPRATPIAPEPCYDPRDPLCEEPPARPASSAKPRPAP